MTAHDELGAFATDAASVDGVIESIETCLTGAKLTADSAFGELVRVAMSMQSASAHDPMISAQLVRAYLRVGGDPEGLSIDRSEFRRMRILSENGAAVLGPRGFAYRHQEALDMSLPDDELDKQYDSWDAFWAACDRELNDDILGGRLHASWCHSIPNKSTQTIDEKTTEPTAIFKQVSVSRMTEKQRWRWGILWPGTKRWHPILVQESILHANGRTEHCALPIVEMARGNLYMPGVSRSEKPAPLRRNHLVNLLVDAAYTVQLERRYDWTVNVAFREPSASDARLGRSKYASGVGQGVDLETDAEGALAFIRSMSLATDWRRPLIHWVRGHYRRRRGGSASLVRSHLRGHHRHEIGDLSFTIWPSRADLDAAHGLRAAEIRAADRAAE